ncbi:ABC transporter permease [Microbacterium sp. YY-01]|uniref:ABC transporter permease n=1 Tax=Microbacterium sp. YY-01 TaxID=3421634 RepID=UPI003D16B919
MINRRRITAPPWIYSMAFAAAVLILIVVATGRGGTATFLSALTLVPYLVLVGTGQMLVMTSGPGNIDVSVASVISLAGYVSIAVSSSTGSAWLGILAAIGVGLATAFVSVIAITVASIPPIVATLASGLIVSSFTLTMANGFSGTAAPGLRAFVNASLFRVPWLAILTALFTVGIALMLIYTVYGRRLLAVGQAYGAADYARIRPARIMASTYFISGALAGLTGALLAAFIAPTPDLGGAYLLDSIAVVVIGGTLISGGRAVPLGVWGGAMFFILLDALLNLVGWSLAGQNILKGLLVLAVLFLAGGRPKLNRKQRATGAVPADADPEDAEKPTVTTPGATA